MYSRSLYVLFSYRTYIYVYVYVCRVVALLVPCVGGAIRYWLKSEACDWGTVDSEKR